MISFDKIVNKLWKKCWKVVFKNDIFEMLDPEMKKQNLTKVNKLIYRLSSENIIKSIRNWVYIIPDKYDLGLNEIDLIEKYYYSLIKKYITKEIGSYYYISWIKSLELHMKNFEVPDKIIVINRSLNKKVMIWNYTIIFKTIWANYKGKKINLYSKLSKFTTILSYNNLSFRVSSLELSIVESAIISDSENGLNVGLLTKAIKKYSKVLNYDDFREIWKLKFIMSFNRLKELSKNIDKPLSNLFLDIIKKNGWLFIWEGLRWV